MELAWGRYQRGGKAHKSKILDEFCQVCGCARKHAIRLFRAKPRLRKKPGPEVEYGPEVATGLKRIWLASDQLCSKRLKDRGFGPDGDRTLKKALRKYLKAGKGRKAELVVKEISCFDVCPKNAVIAVNAANPKALLIVPAGADLFEVKARLGLDDGRRLKPDFKVVGEG